MGRTAVQSTDYSPSDDYAGVVDYEQFRTTGFRPIEQISDREWADNKEAELFMHERVVINIHGTSDKNAPRAIFVGVNNDQAWLPRGQPIRVPRYMVEVLAHSQPWKFRQEDNPNPEAMDGKITTHTTSPAVPFEVLQDRNPNGRRWLQRVMREGC